MGGQQAPWLCVTHFLLRIKSLCWCKHEAPKWGWGGPPEAKTASGEAPQQYNEVTLNTHSLSTQYYRFSGKEKRRREGRRPILSIYYIQY